MQTSMVVMDGHAWPIQITRESISRTDERLYAPLPELRRASQPHMLVLKDVSGTAGELAVA